MKGYQNTWVVQKEHNWSLEERAITDAGREMRRQEGRRERLLVLEQPPPLQEARNPGEASLTDSLNTEPRHPNPHSLSTQPTSGPAETEANRTQPPPSEG